MCGIAGFFGSAPAANFADRALRCLATRGPDGSGTWFSPAGDVGLIHTRLAILDLTEASRQPMAFCEKPATHVEDHAKSPGRFWLIFNGEIYNFRELRRSLEAQGETFTTTGDTEVLLRLLIREGVACLPKLAGMFAFAFWNEDTETGLLVRDPLGIKPLYYSQSDDSVAFASECRVLRHGNDAIDPTALRDFFLWGSVPDPETLYQDIRQLSAGHLLRWSRKEITIECWHQITLKAPDPSILSYHFAHRKAARSDFLLAADLTRVALEESISRHLVSDVPVGIFLSGGIDSTILLALTRQTLGPRADIRTFSIGFEDPEFDESELARRTAEHFGATHTEWMMSPEEGAAEVGPFLEAIDQPGIDGFNTWCVSKLAQREGLKVVLSGLGGDELFAGYQSFDQVPRYRTWRKALGPLRHALAAVLDLQEAGSPFRRLSAFFRGHGDWLHAYHVQRGIFTAEEAAELSTQLAGVPAKTNWTVPLLPSDSKDVISLLEITRYMRNQLLRDSDVYSMAHGLELRVPFVDVRLIETLFSLPPKLRLRRGKQLLLDAVPEVPEWVRNQSKRGFRFPFERWMEGQFGDLLDTARDKSPVPLKLWYRTWAVAVAIKSISTVERCCEVGAA
ncbi:MAG: asparagine synthase (glutamine-hydrolyzing) [Chthoniobacterales bacterium]